jgi:hypothetical protein
VYTGEIRAKTGPFRFFSRSNSIYSCEKVTHPRIEDEVLTKRFQSKINVFFYTQAFKKEL